MVKYLVNHLSRFDLYIVDDVSNWIFYNIPIVFNNIDQ